MSKTETPLSADELKRLAEGLTGGATPVAKAADADAKKDEGEEKDEKANPFEKKDVEKSVTLSEAELGTLIEKAVDAGFVKATAAFTELLAPVSKSLDVLTGDSEAIRAFQGATTMVLTNFKENSDGLKAEVANLKEISKSIHAEVEAIGDQPATPRSVTVVEKSVEMAPAAPAIDMERVREVAKSMDDVHDRVSVRKYAEAGNVAALHAMLTPVQRRQVFPGEGA